MSVHWKRPNLSKRLGKATQHLSSAKKAAAKAGRVALAAAIQTSWKICALQRSDEEEIRKKAVESITDDQQNEAEQVGAQAFRETA
jgi:hypothetical protein